MPARAVPQPSATQSEEAAHNLAELPLSALLSMTLVAFTIEADNEFEARFRDAGHGEQLSLVAWFWMLQYLAGDEPVTVADLMARTYTTRKQCAGPVALLERWGFAIFELPPGSPPPPLKKTGLGRGVIREGWGNGSGVGEEWVPRLTPKGRTAAKVWPDALAATTARWEKRFSPTLAAVRTGLDAVAATSGLDMPDGLPTDPWVAGTWRQFPEATARPMRPPLPVGMSRALVTLTANFERTSQLPLQLMANAVRVITVAGVPEGQLAALTGLADQVAGLQATAVVRLGLATREASSAGRGRILRLTTTGKKGQRDYHRLAAQAEQVDAATAKATEPLKAALVSLLTTQTDDHRLALVDALIPPAGVRRSGVEGPAAGRFTVGAGARARNRQLVAQTTAFLADPLGSLPHYPVWDGNRALGP